MAERIQMVGQPRRELEREHAHGYKLEEVVADLVDNSIDANADNIWVIFAEETYTNKVPQEKKYKTKDSFFLIVMDDGSGIDDEGINSVMDFGAPRVYDELELGKFGVGMKSSSLSQAKEITLLSKVAGGNIELRRLSSEIVYDDDEWVLIPELEDHMNTDAISIAKRELAELESGTCIVLEDMHKLDNRIGTEASKSAYMDKEVVHIRDYLALCFERYIRGVTLRRNDGSTVERQVNIFLNGNDHINRIPLLDPFCVERHDGTVTGTLKHEFQAEVNREGSRTLIPITIWIIPNDKSGGRLDYCQFGDDDYDDRMKNAARDSGISELQGLYVYRNERLINFGGWNNVLKHDPHYTCLRWEIHFPSSLDEIFQLDPSKRDIRLPTELFEVFTQVSRRKVRWHSDDPNSQPHRPRAKKRQKGADAPRARPLRGPTPPSAPTPSTGSSGPTPSSAPTPTTSVARPNSPTSIRVKEIPAVATGNLIISERGSDSEITVILNSNHPLYREFISKINEL